MDASQNQLRATQYCRERVVEVVRHTGSQLPESAQFVRACRAFALLLLLGNIMSDAKDTGHLAIDDNRRGVHQRVANRAVSGHVSRFESLRLAIQTCDETRAAHVALSVMNVLEEMASNEVAHFEPG